MITGMLRTKDYRYFTIEAAEPIEFDGATLAGRAFPGDTVCWDGICCRLRERGAFPLFLVGTLELNSKTRYGMTSRGAPIYRFQPYDPAYPPFFVGCSQKDTSKAVLVKVQFTDWEEGATCPRGTLVQTFGLTGDLAAEEAALLAHYGAARWRRGDFAEEDLMMPARPVGAVELPRKGFGTFHIDPPGCRDIDDAVTLFELEAGLFQLRIHIADVASWLIANSGLAEKAEEIGQTLYRDGVAVRPMFPLELSEGHFSLLPGELRGAVTLVIHWKRGTGLVGAPAWCYDLIRVDGSWTYDAAQSAPWADVMASITSDMARRVVADPHEWVEQLMLFYNTEAARLLRASGLGVLRRHSAPDRDRLAAAEAAGVPVELVAYGAGEYCAATEKDVRHWGLGADVYCHASSPIRRWADCLNQLALFQALYGEAVGPTVDAAALVELKRGAKAAKNYERDLQFVRVLLGSSGRQSFTAVVLREGEIWVHEWRRRLAADTKGLEAGAPVRAYIFHDASKRGWKRRLVVRVDET
jgi:exoribonuclease R